VIKKLLSQFLVTAILFLPVAGSAALLTDISVFSSNSDGHFWNGLLWNTQGSDTDGPNRWNLYVSDDALSDLTPSFINGFNDSQTRIALPLLLGDNTFSLYAEGVNTTFHPLQHFAMNLYFDGVQSVPEISGVQNLTNTGLTAAGSPNGLDIFGNTWQQEAGSLSTTIGDLLITLTDFSWITDSQRDVVWPHWANDTPYSGGSGFLDFYGSFTLSVESVPEPTSLFLISIGLAGIGWKQRKAA